MEERDKKTGRLIIEAFPKGRSPGVRTILEKGSSEAANAFLEGVRDSFERARENLYIQPYSSENLYVYADQPTLLDWDAFKGSLFDMLRACSERPLDIDPEEVERNCLVDYLRERMAFSLGKSSHRFETSIRPAGGADDFASFADSTDDDIVVTIPYLTYHKDGERRVGGLFVSRTDLADEETLCLFKDEFLRRFPKLGRVTVPNFDLEPPPLLGVRDVDEMSERYGVVPETYDAAAAASLILERWGVVLEVS